jgi:hypothetical protein
MNAFEHIQLPDGRRLDVRVSGPIGGFRWCSTMGRLVPPLQCGHLTEQPMREDFAW